MQRQTPAHTTAAPLGGGDWLGLLAVLLITVAAFANGLVGEFVIDDNRQIVRNELIRDPSRWGQALTRDVWAFLGDRADRPWSNYWRPGHVAWLILNVQLFGASTPLPWHATSLLAHLGVITTAFVALRWLGLTRGVSLAIVALYAVHPTRCESVTWIAGVHDVLCALWQLLALLCVMSAWHNRSGRLWKWSAAVALYSMAILTKEIALFFPIILAAVRLTEPELAAEPRRARWRSALLATAPFVAIGAMFLIARYLVLGRTQLDFPFKPSLASTVASLPLVVTTYLRLIVFPWPIGWTYPVRAVNGANMGLATFWIPLACLTFVICLGARIRWTHARLIGGLVFGLTLLPALNLRAFPPDNLVKDRFLYMPLLGFLMIVVTLADEALRRAFPPTRGHTASRIGVCAMLALTLVFAGRAFQYNTAWLSETALWQWATRTDPSSALNFQMLSVALMEEERFDESRTALEQSLARARTSQAVLALADLNLKTGKYEAATEAATEVVRLAPGDYRGHERLAISYEKRLMPRDAERAIREAISAIPFRRAHFSDQLAVVLYQQGRAAEAQRVLEEAAPAARTEFGATARLVFFRLGVLYAEQGRATDARAAMSEFLRLTEGSAEPNVVAARKAAAAFVRQ